ncbi:hypothetical protein FCM35_KLT18788 [Carex littledalei]|uniref:Uncharacterized protein n=1 Tax=Carex littledalei TaxID=544730 RepID=A0A833RD76_9POAL|nr:hypothetical protein FCM35_KLT18788 [Carex littledalei]
MAGSWSRRMTWTWPFRKAKTTTPSSSAPHDSNNSNQSKGNDHHVKILRGEVMACGYEDVHVMWSILDKSNQTGHRPS